MRPRCSPILCQGVHIDSVRHSQGPGLQTQPTEARSQAGIWPQGQGKDVHWLPTLRFRADASAQATPRSYSGHPMKKRALGAVNIRTGAFIRRVFDRHSATESIEFLAHTVAQCPTGKIHIILDSFSVHKARSVATRLAGHLRVRLYSLRCHMLQLNPVVKA